MARSQLLNELPAFFQAYASGDGAALSRFNSPGVSLTGLGGAVAFDSIAGVDIAGGVTRQIIVTVIWQLPEPRRRPSHKTRGRLQRVGRELQSGKWYVKEISASTEAVGAK